MDLGLHGKVAVVTGASRGIGKAVAKGLIQEGCKVAICARRAERLHSAVADLSQGKNDPGERRVLGVTTDVTDEAAVQSALPLPTRRSDG
jgi:3-oxoacyl-[acyl-carrier protein] reductase